MLPFLSLLSLTTLLPPTGPGPTDSLVIFNANRTYHYRAAFISPSGDTLSRERITLQPSGESWVAQKKTQIAFRVLFKYTPQDSVTFSTRLNPESKSPDKPKPYIWTKSYTTGAIENKQEVWIHPIRDNQYSYTEVAPFPQVKRDSLIAGGGWGSRMVFLFQGAFNGKAANRYQVEKQETRQYGSVVMPGCWLIQAVGEHSKLGKSYLDFYFHPQYGFTEMHYRFYDGTRIDFVLEQVLDKRTP